MTSSHSEGVPAELDIISMDYYYMGSGPQGQADVSVPGRHRTALFVNATSWNGVASVVFARVFL